MCWSRQWRVIGGSRPSGRLRIATCSWFSSVQGSGAWQPSFGAAEDRNVMVMAAMLARPPWQPSFGAAEDRNLILAGRSAVSSVWQPSFGAAEDRNTDGRKT